MVAGTSATFADVSDAIDRDMHLILPVAAALILLILVVTLRSAVAPLYLLAAVALEFGATLGAAMLVFQLLGDAAASGSSCRWSCSCSWSRSGRTTTSSSLPGCGRRCSPGPVREAVAGAVRHVAPAVGAAGLVLATSFGTLMLEADEARSSRVSRWPSGSSWPPCSSPRSSCRR